MAEKLILKDGETPNTYILEPVLRKSEPSKGEYPCKIGVFHKKPIDGCWVVELCQSQDYDAIVSKLGIAKNIEEIPDRTYAYAIKAGQNYAKKLGCELIDETKRAKSSKLEQLAESQVEKTKSFS